MGALPWYLSNLRVLRDQRKRSTVNFKFGKFHPCLDDKRAEGGSTSGHYFHQDLLVARRIYQNKPIQHVDVGSRIDGFVAHVASYRSIVVVDIRTISNVVPNITFMQADLMNRPPEHLVDFCDSLSCLHALEHFGLGRYGDPINYEGYLTGLANITTLLKSGGKFYFSVPIGQQRIEFNAHRIFSVAHLLDCLTNAYRIDHFSYVDDSGDLHEHVSLSESEIARSFNCSYGCGIFEMTKL
jgi:hypothetical protein